MYESLATLTLIIHFLFIIFVIFGGLLFFIKPWTLYFHVPAFLYGVYIYPINLTKQIHISLGIALLIINGIIYGFIIVRREK
jgi:hypothetical protein